MKVSGMLLISEEIGYFSVPMLILPYQTCLYIYILNVRRTWVAYNSDGSWWVELQ